MSSALLNTVRLSASAAGQELVDAADGRSVRVSDLEAAVIALWDGAASATQLADLAQSRGVLVTSGEVSVLLDRLAKAGFLKVQPKNDAPAGPGAFEVQVLSDVVPRLRKDLKPDKQTVTGGVVSVTDPVKNKTFTVYDFEWSIARMLDGKRTVADVIDASARIGMPVTVESLRKFLRQMRAYGFIEDAGVQPGGSDASTWAPRANWSPAVRELYQSALRLARQHKPQEALGYLDALLAMEPDQPEAVALKKEMEAAKKAPPPKTPAFADLHGTDEEDDAVTVVAAKISPELLKMAGAASPPSAPPGAAAPAPLAAAPPAPAAPAPRPSSPASPLVAPAPGSPLAIPPEPAPPAAGAPVKPTDLPAYSPSGMLKTGHDPFSLYAPPPAPGTLAPESAPEPEAVPPADEFPGSTPSDLLKTGHDPFALYDHVPPVSQTAKSGNYAPIGTTKQSGGYAPVPPPASSKHSGEFAPVPPSIPTSTQVYGQKEAGASLNKDSGGFAPVPAAAPLPPPQQKPPPGKPVPDQAPTETEVPLPGAGHGPAPTVMSVDFPPPGPSVPTEPNVTASVEVRPSFLELAKAEVPAPGPQEMPAVSAPEGELELEPDLEPSGPQDEDGYPLPSPESTPKGKGGLVAKLVLAVALLGGLAGGAAFALHPVPWVRTARCDIAPKLVGAPQSPRDGVVLRVEVKDGDRVEAEAALVTLDDAPLLDQRRELQARLRKVVEKRKKLKPSPSRPKVAKATKAVKKAGAAVAALEKRREKVEGGKLPEAKKNASLKLIDKQLAPKRKALEKAQAALERLTHEEAIAGLDAERDEVKQQLKALDEARERSTVTAPVAGTFEAQGLAAGAEVSQGADVGRLTDGYTLSARPSPPLGAPPKSLTLALPSGPVQPALTEAAGTFSGTLPPQDTPLPKEATLTFDLGTRPFWQTLVGGE